MKTEILADFQICINVPSNIFLFQEFNRFKQTGLKGTFKIKAISP